MTTTAAHDDEVMSDIDAITDVIAADDQRRATAADRAPRGFDPAALFLLTLGFENLYDPTPTPHVFVCKGCRQTVKRGDRRTHHRSHARTAGYTNGGGNMATRNNSKGTTPAVEVDTNGIMRELFKRAKAAIKGIVVKPNDKVGYTAIRYKDDGPVLAFVWPMKSGVRVEAALDPKDIADSKQRKLVTKSLRSSRLRAQTKVADDDGIAVALAMLERAHELTVEQQTAKADKAQKAPAKTRATAAAGDGEVKPDPKPSQRKTKATADAPEVPVEDTAAVPA